MLACKHTGSSNPVSTKAHCGRQLCMALMHSVSGRNYAGGGSLAHTQDVLACSLPTARSAAAAPAGLCRVHVAKSLQDGSTYAAKVLPKVTNNKSKARQQLQSKS